MLPRDTIKFIEPEGRHDLRIPALIRDVKEKGIAFAVAHRQLVARRCERERKA
jgi:hypothetical protein